MSTEWITDRLPTKQDADEFGDVWVTLGNGFVCEWNWRSVKPQMPWQPTNKPAPYVVAVTVEKELYQSQVARLEELEAQNEQMLNALQSIRDRWNRDTTEKAMHDACWYAINAADAILDNVERKQP